MGFAGLVAERLLGATEFVDVEFAISNPTSYFGARALVPRRPDFIMWAPGTPVFIIECKGSQTTKSAVIGQLRRGLEQLPSIDIGTSPKVSLVVATHMKKQDAVVYVVDPPDGGDDSIKRTPKRVDSSIDQVGGGRFVVSDLVAFREKLRVGGALTRLRWAGQHETASAIERSITDRPSQSENANIPLQRLETDVGSFLGTTSPAAPELGPRGPQVFRGVRRDFLEEFSGSARTIGAATEIEERLDAANPCLSVGSDGNCLAMVGLEM